MGVDPLGGLGHLRFLGNGNVEAGFSDGDANVVTAFGSSLADLYSHSMRHAVEVFTFGKNKMVVTKPTVPWVADKLLLKRHTDFFLERRFKK